MIKIKPNSTEEIISTLEKYQKEFDNRSMYLELSHFEFKKDFELISDENIFKILKEGNLKTFSQNRKLDDRNNLVSYIISSRSDGLIVDLINYLNSSEKIYYLLSNNNKLNSKTITALLNSKYTDLKIKAEVIKHQSATRQQIEEVYRICKGKFEENNKRQSFLNNHLEEVSRKLVKSLVQNHNTSQEIIDDLHNNTNTRLDSYAKSMLLNHPNTSQYLKEIFSKDENVIQWNKIGEEIAKRNKKRRKKKVVT